MSRFIAIALLVILAGDTGFAALPAGSESSLPACCRRDGKHHCAMFEMLEKQQENAGPACSAVARKCPSFPRSTVASFAGESTPPPGVDVFAGLISKHPVLKAQTGILYYISHSRTRQKRGPPSAV